MTRHDRHERWIDEVLSGERPEAEAELEQCPECLAQLRRLQRLTARLDDAGAEQRSVMAEAMAMRDAVGEERVAALVRAQLPTPTRTRWPQVVLAAAALLVVGLLAWLRFDGPHDGGGGSTQRPTDRNLGGAKCSLQWSDDGRPVFSWTGDPDTLYVVELFIPGQILPAHEKSISDLTWTPEAELVETMKTESQNWTWQVHRAGEPAPGSGAQGFSFSR